MWDLAAEASRPSAAGTASAALKLATLNAVLAFATCTYISPSLRCSATIATWVFLIIDIQQTTRIGPPVKRKCSNSQHTIIYALKLPADVPLHTWITETRMRDL